LWVVSTPALLFSAERSVVCPLPTITRFDPISQKEVLSSLCIFNNVDESRPSRAVRGQKPPIPRKVPSSEEIALKKAFDSPSASLEPRSCFTYVRNWRRVPENLVTQDPSKDPGGSERVHNLRALSSR